MLSKCKGVLRLCACEECHHSYMYSLRCFVFCRVLCCKEQFTCCLFVRIYLLIINWCIFQVAVCCCSIDVYQTCVQSYFICLKMKEHSPGCGCRIQMNRSTALFRNGHCRLAKYLYKVSYFLFSALKRKFLCHPFVEVVNISIRFDRKERWGPGGYSKHLGPPISAHCEGLCIRLFGKAFSQGHEA